MLGLEDDALAVALVALDGSLAARLGLDHRDDDVVELRAFLLAHQHQVAVADVGVDHAVTAHAKREQVLTPTGQRPGSDWQLAVPILLRQQRLPGRDASRDGDGSASATAGRFAQRERACRPSAGSTLQHALALERTEMIEGRPWRDAKLVADLADCRRHAVTGGEGPHEIQ